MKGLEALKELTRFATSWNEAVSCELANKLSQDIEKELKEYEKIKAIKGTTTFDKAIENTLIDACPNVAKKLKALEFLRERIVINEMDGYVEFYCGFSLPTNSKYENEEHYKEKIALLKEVLL